MLCLEKVLRDNGGEQAEESRIRSFYMLQIEALSQMRLDTFPDREHFIKRSSKKS